MAKPNSRRSRSSRPAGSDITKPAFDFHSYLFLLERVLPKRSKARKLLPQLELHVDNLRLAAKRPWETFDERSGTERDQATTNLFESIMKIPPEWRYQVGVKPALLASELKDVPDDVLKDVEKLLARERNFCYLEPFVSLRLKGEVTLTDECVPVEGSIHARYHSGGEERTAHAILDEIEDIKSTTEQYDLQDQPGAAQKLPDILKRTKELAAELNDLCNTEHL